MHSSRMGCGHTQQRGIDCPAHSIHRMGDSYVYGSLSTVSADFKVPRTLIVLAAYCSIQHCINCIKASQQHAGMPPCAWLLLVIWLLTFFSFFLMHAGVCLDLPGHVCVFAAACRVAPPPGLLEGACSELHARMASMPARHLSTCVWALSCSSSERLHLCKTATVLL